MKSRRGEKQEGREGVRRTKTSAIHEAPYVQFLLDILHNNRHLSFVDGRSGCGHFVSYSNCQLVSFRGLRLHNERPQ